MSFSYESEHLVYQIYGGDTETNTYTTKVEKNEKFNTFYGYSRIRKKKINGNVLNVGREALLLATSVVRHAIFKNVFLYTLYILQQN